MAFPGGANDKESTGQCWRQEMRVQSLGQEDTLEEGMANLSSIPAAENPMNRAAWWATVHKVERVGHDSN